MKSAARIFPTHLMGERRWLAALWRVLFYGIRPTEPFLFRTRDYDMVAVPERWHLSRSVVRKGHWESYVTDLFRSYLRPGMTVIDAGANYGHYALTAANQVGPEGLVLAFEPMPSVYDDLKRNAALIPHKNIQTFDVALGDTNGVAVLAVDASTSGWSSLVEGLVADPRESITVPVRRLADVLEEAAPSCTLGLIKIDTEGYEAQVLRGAWGVLERDLPVVFMEFSEDRIRRAGEDAENLLERLFALGYQAKIIDEHHSRLVPVSLPVKEWVDRYGESINNVDSIDWFVNMVLEPQTPTGPGG
jgi:FkbM family methyltransferase